MSRHETYFNLSNQSSPKKAIQGKNLSPIFQQSNKENII